MFSAEICAINLALKLVSMRKSSFIQIPSVLQSLKTTKLVKLLYKLNFMNHSKKVIFCCIPSHIGISGKDKADSLAKAALNMMPDLKKKKKKKNWPQTENQANNYKEMATIMREKNPTSSSKYSPF